MSRPSFELVEVVRAGAGAGKTTQLTQRVMGVADDYYRAHGQWPRLVVTTFTRKATQELRERLITKSCEMGRLDLLDYVASSGQLHISTLHGVFSRFLRGYAHLLDLESQFSLAREEEVSRLARQVLHRILFGESGGGGEKRDRKEVHSLDGSDFSSLIHAYGFDRTAGLLLRLYRLHMEFPNLEACGEADFKEVLQRKAKGYARSFHFVLERVETGFSSPAWMKYKGRCHSLSELLERGEWVGGSDLLEGVRKPPRPKEACEETDRHLKELVDDVKKWLGDLSNDPLQWEEFFHLSTDLEKLFGVFKEEFQGLKRESGVLEISDLEFLTYRAILQEPQLAGHFSGEWDYWFIDEYQDTSPLQVEILNHFMGDRPFFIVGDPQQSIYLFRGARSEVFDLKQRETLSRGGELTILDKNYRSRPELLWFFNDFFADLSSHFQPMRPRGEGVSKKDVVATYSIADRGDEHLGRTHYEDVAIYNHIQGLLAGGEECEGICILARTHRHLNEIAHFLGGCGLSIHVHASSGFHERREVLDALGLLKFMINPHDNLNLVSVLRSPWFRLEDKVIVDALSSLGRAEAPTGPADRDPEGGEALSKRGGSFLAPPRSYWKALCRYDSNEGGSLQSLTKLLERASEVGLSEAWREVLIQCGLLDLSRKQDPSGRRESNLWKLLTRLVREERRPGFNYLSFVNSLLRGEWEEGGDAVACLEPRCINLMTIHAAKGLKFKHVIVPRMDRPPLLTERSSSKSLLNLDERVQRWTLAVPLGGEKKMHHSPLAREIFERFSQREREESLRLLYVALTRAESSVFLSWVGEVKGDSWAQQITVPGNGLLLSSTSFGGSRVTAPPLGDVAKDAGAEKNGSMCEVIERTHYVVRVQRGRWERTGDSPKDSLSEVAPLPRVSSHSSTSLPASPSASASALVSSPPRPPWGEAFQATRRSSVSQLLERGEGGKNEKIEASSFLARLQGASEGVLLHRMMESLRYGVGLDDEGSGRVSWMQREWGERWEEAQRALRFVQGLKVPPMEELLKTGWVEWGFQMHQRSGEVESSERGAGRRDSLEGDLSGGTGKLPGRRDVVEGQVDLWGRVCDEKGREVVWVIDYKSGSEKYLEKAFRQLNFYAQAFRAYGVREPIQLAVIYPFREVVKVREA